MFTDGGQRGTQSSGKVQGWTQGRPTGDWRGASGTPNRESAGVDVEK